MSLLYALTLRADHQTAKELAVNAGGISPLWLGVSSAFFPNGAMLGGFLDAGFERFSVSGDGGQGAQVSARLMDYRIGAGATGKLPVTPKMTVEGQLGYCAGGMPSLVVDARGLRSETLAFHGPLLGAVARFAPTDAMGVQVWARALPLALGSVGVRQFSAGASASMGTTDLLGLSLSPVFAYELSSASVGASDRSAAQVGHRLGFGARLASRMPPPQPKPKPPPPPLPTTGKLRGVVLFPRDRSPVPGATVTIPGAGEFRTDDKGVFLVPSLGPGSVLVQAKAPGYRTVQLPVDVAVGAEATVELVLPAPTGPGRIRGVVRALVPRSGGEKVPVQAAPVYVGALAPVKTAVDGTFLVEQAGPGPVPLYVLVKGYKRLEEIVAVPPEAEASIDLTLQKEGAGSPATLSGLIRSTEGKPLRATLTIAETRSTTTALPNGRFRILVPGGKYTIDVTAAGHAPQTKIVEIDDGDQVIFNVELYPEKK